MDWCSAALSSLITDCPRVHHRSHDHHCHHHHLLGWPRWLQPNILLVAFWYILSRPDRHWEGQVSVLDISDDDNGDGDGDDDNGDGDGDNDGDHGVFWLTATKY